MTGHSFSTIKRERWYENGKRKRHRNDGHHPSGTDDFIAVDGEGVTLPDGEHRYVLFGAGDEQIENPDGLQWEEIFEFLYRVRRPRTAFVGFYLGYDFTQWIKTMPEDRARKLLTIDGKEQRRSKSKVMHGRFLPVSLGEWEIDMLGSKRLQFRHRPCRCLTVKCDHEAGPWVYICDAGGFFQTSFLNVINPKNWQEPIVTDEEYATIVKGKEARSSAQLDHDMHRYNLLENEILQRVMRDLDKGFCKIDLFLTPQQWFGPGQAAQAWMRLQGVPKLGDVESAVPAWFLEAAAKSYFGGWFEIMCHGIVEGTSHEYDINSAYPWIISTLPCLLHGRYTRGTGTPKPSESDKTLVYAHIKNRAKGNGGLVGTMLHRDDRGRISRPRETSGWYWWHELQAGKAAGCITSIKCTEWVTYSPCDCQPPLWRIRMLYQMRLDVGKNTSLGKAAKLIYNSMYGKFAQSVGQPVFGNPIYASLITSGCRTMGLDAIATHPKGQADLLMVATDAVYFLSEHPSLPLSDQLGEWDHAERSRLTLFKPGVYWDDAARTAIQTGEHAVFKARGVNAREFSASIAEIDRKFSVWDGKPPPVDSPMFNEQEMAALGFPQWPRVTFKAGFAMTTALQALIRHKWHLAGVIDSGDDGTGKIMVQSANPSDKRTSAWYDSEYDPQRPLYRSWPHEQGRNGVESVPYEKRFGLEDPFSDENQQAQGISPDEHQPYRGAFRLLTGEE